MPGQNRKFCPVFFRERLLLLAGEWVVNWIDGQIMSFSGEIVPFAAMKEWRKKVRASGCKLVATNGCFDLLHAGHVKYLTEARALGDMLLVGLNGDASVRSLKGEGRPVNNEQDRATILTALRCVDAVCVFPEVRATGFLELAQPEIYVKGGDYTLETLNPEERAVVEAGGGQIAFISFLAGRSTTSILQKLAK